MNRNERIRYLASELMKRDLLLRQYSIWLETSEEFTHHDGVDIYNMLVGSLHAIDGSPDFIPGTGWKNFVDVIRKVQEEVSLDLGVCQYLEIIPKETLSKCKAKESLLVSSLSACIPPQRIDCEYRIRKLEEEADSAR